MNPITVAIVAFVVVAGVSILVAALAFRLVPAFRRDRLALPVPVTDSRAILRWDDNPRTGWQAVVERVGKRFGPRNAEDLTRYRRRLILAGYDNPRAVAIFVGAKIGLALAAALSYPIYGALAQRVMPNMLAVSFGLAAVGLMFPDLWLWRRTSTRRLAIQHALPDALDLLTVCVEGGMGFDAAVARIADQPEAKDSPLHKELMHVHLQVRAGRPRAEALRGLGERCGVDDIKSLVGAFIQADRLGTPLGKTLRVYSESARLERKRRAEAKAALVSVKMIFPLVFFLMPSFMLVALGPSLLMIVKLLGGIK